MMGLLNKELTFLHFDETYFNQTKLSHYSHEDLDLRQLEHVNLYCEESSLQFLEKTLSNRSRKGITFIGSGNYHYVSYLLLKEISKPFTLVLFDHHPDLGTGHDETILSCGSWVAYALKELPLLQKVIIIGPTELLPSHTHNPRIVIFPIDGSHYYSPKSILSAIHTENVYISIDKDVLNTEEAVTNWDQGMLDTAALMNIMNSILENKQVEGVDICGEAHISPAEAVLPNYQAMIQKNQCANMKILNKCLETSVSHTRGA